MIVEVAAARNAPGDQSVPDSQLRDWGQHSRRYLQCGCAGSKRNYVTMTEVHIITNNAKVYPPHLTHMLDFSGPLAKYLSAFIGLLFGYKALSYFLSPKKWSPKGQVSVVWLGAMICPHTLFSALLCHWRDLWARTGRC